MHFGSDGKLYVAVGDNRRRRECAEPELTARQAAALQRRRQHPQRQPVLHHARQPGVRRLGPRPAQPVHPCRAARHRPHPRQRCRVKSVGRNQCRCARRQLWMAGDRRAHQRHRRHPADVHVRARRNAPVASRAPDRAASSSAVRHRRCLLSRQRPVPGALARRLLLHRFRRRLRRLRRPEQRQRGLFVRQRRPEQPVGMLVASDGAVLVLQRRSITRFTAP